MVKVETTSGYIPLAALALAALPQHMAVSLRLTVARTKYF